VSDRDTLRGGTLTAPDGCRLVHVAEGTGPTVVFAHGGLARASAWIGVADLLRDTFNCVMFDQRGHGASDWGGGPDLTRATEDLLFVIDQLGPVHAVVGHSYGALVALEATRVASVETIPRLAVYEPPLSVIGPIMSEATIDQIGGAVATADYEAALLLHLRSNLGGLSEAEVENFRTNPMLRAAYADIVVQAPSIAPALRSCIRLDSAEPFRAIEVPTLLLLGTASAHEPFRTSIDALLDVVPKAELATLEGQGHMALMFAPQLVADELRRFLTGTA
jgi:pimeloyl-ACP methyl ester carboxylesterase